MRKATLLDRLIPYRRRALDLQDANDGLLRVIANPLIEGIKLGNGTFGMDTSGGAAALLAGMFIDMLDEKQVLNCIELEFGSEKHGPIQVTVQKLRGELPMALANRWKAERDEALEALRLCRQSHEGA